MLEEDERPPNEKSHANHFSITYNGCEFCLLTPPAILARPNAYLKDDVCKFVVSFAYKILFSSLELKLFDIAQR